MASELAVCMASNWPDRSAFWRLSMSTAATASMASRYGRSSPVMPFGPRQ